MGIFFGLLEVTLTEIILIRLWRGREKVSLSGAILDWESIL